MSSLLAASQLFGRARAALMTASATLWAAVPLLVWVGTRSTSTWLFVGVWHLAYAVTLAASRQVARKRDVSRSRIKVVADLDGVRRRDLWASVIFYAYWVPFAVSVTLTDPVVVAILYELWTVFFAAITLTRCWRRTMLDGGPLDRSAARSTLGAVLVAAAGASLVTLSSEEAQASWTFAYAAGVALAVFAALLSAASLAFVQRVGQHAVDGRNDHQTADARQAASMAVSAVGQASVGVLLCAISFIVWLVDWGGFARQRGTSFSLRLPAQVRCSRTTCSFRRTTSRATSSSNALPASTSSTTSSRCSRQRCW